MKPGTGPLRSWHYAMTPPLQHQRPPCCPCCLPGPPALRHQRWNSTNGCLLPAWNSSKGWSPCKWIENGSKMNQQIKVAWKNPCNKPNEKKPGMEGMFCNNRSGIHFLNTALYNYIHLKPMPMYAIMMPLWCTSKTLRLTVTLTVSSTDPCLITMSLTANQTVRLTVGQSVFQGVSHAKN